MFSLDTKIENLSGVGKKTAKLLCNLEIDTVEDLLYYFPYRYDDFSQITPIEKIKSNTTANIVGEIELIQSKRSPRKRMSITEAIIKDESGSIKVIWFNQPFISKNLHEGDKVSLAGKVEADFSGAVMMSPIYEKINFTGGVHTQGLVPNYHLTAGITQKQLRFFIKQALYSAKLLVDWLPPEIQKNANLISLAEAIKKIHFPKDNKEINEAKKRLSFNELFLLQMQNLLIREELKTSKAKPLNFFEKETKEFVKKLPFQLTNTQRQSAWEIIKDLNNSRPMTRLLQGDVGSGKTIVACLAILNAVLNKTQAVLMVPTEILAKQHYDSLCKLFANYDFKIGLMTSNQKEMNQVSSIKYQGDKEKESKKKTLNTKYIIQNTDIIIGTHALIQEDVVFKNLALAIIDEQHRFGVKQRSLLLSKSGNNLSPHLLSMTATPIPRSLALALYGELDLSIINEMPQGRKKISTHIVPEEKRQKAYEFIGKEIVKGRQVFVICPLIDPSDKGGLKSVKEEFEKLDKKIFPELSIGLLHGRLKSAEKEKIMQKFLANEIKILVSTSVIEVGIDIPNATIMMIEGADKFGLAQLHQFRGRVGRSTYESYCFLFTDNNSPQAIIRLQAMEKHHSGFELAKIDLKHRGPGEVFGTSQKGFPELKIASLFDYELMKKAKAEAEGLLKQDKKLVKSPILKKKLQDIINHTHIEYV